MLTMIAHGWVLLSALRFLCVSSNDEANLPNPSQGYSNVCTKHNRSAHLGSSVLLPCIFAPNGSNSVIWYHGPKRPLVQFISEGRIKFVDHRYGRLKAFPNQGSLGNYSIRIDGLEGSDLGLYRCAQGRGCLEVELLADKGAAVGENLLLICACVGVAVFVLVCITGYCCVKCMACCCDRTMDNTNNFKDAVPEVASASPKGTSGGPIGQQQIDEGDNNLVYENDDQDPSIQQDYLNRNYCHPIDRPPSTQGGVDPNQLGGTKQGFHRDFFNRLRQASMGRHYYVNQTEMMRQQAMSTQAKNPSGAAGFGKKKKTKKNGEIRNPIYNQSTEQLNLQ